MNPGRWIRVTDPRLGEALPWRKATAIRPRSAPAAAAAEHRSALIPTFDWPYRVPGALAVVAATASALAFFVPDVPGGEKE